MLLEGDTPGCGHNEGEAAAGRGRPQGGNPCFAPGEYSAEICNSQDIVSDAALLSVYPASSLLLSLLNLHAMAHTHNKSPSSCSAPACLNRWCTHKKANVSCRRSTISKTLMRLLSLTVQPLTESCTVCQITSPTGSLVIRIQR